MDTPLNASAHTAGSLISGSIFEVPPYQREYSWKDEEVKDFFQDIQRSLETNSYFLGLIILTDEDGKKKIVDGQQRVVTLTLLAASIYHEALKRGRSALADRLKADFLTSINYDTDGNDPRVMLSDGADNRTLQRIIAGEKISQIGADPGSVSAEILKSFKFISKELADDLKPDPFKRLGKWADFITNKLYFAVFIHPTPSEAYQVFEVINTRGRDLTTADLLKNYILSQIPADLRDGVYERWKNIADNFETDGNNNIVQYIRHVVTVNSGYVLPKDLFSFLASRGTTSQRQPPAPLELLSMLEDRLSLYLQMVDPGLEGPADETALNIFRALTRLSVITVRPLMLAIMRTPNSHDGLSNLLKLVARRIVVGTLGTGNIERRFSEAAKKVSESGRWESALEELNDLNPDRELFFDQLKKRSLSKNVLSFMRNSILSDSISPNNYYFLHTIAPKSLKEYPGFDEGELSYWGGTLGNSFLTTEEKRIEPSDTWTEFVKNMFPVAAPIEVTGDLDQFQNWSAEAVKVIGARLAERATKIWYD